MSSISIARPAGTVAGDLLLVAIRQKKTTGTVTATGWTAIRQEGTSARSSLLWRVAGSEAGPYAFSLGTTADVEAHILRFSGVATSDPIAASGLGTNSDRSSGTAIEAPSLDAPGGSLYVAIWSAKSSGLTINPAAGTTSRTATSASTTLATGTEVRSSAGLTGVRSAGLNATSDRLIGQAVVLRSAP